MPFQGLEETFYLLLRVLYYFFYLVYFLSKYLWMISALTFHLTSFFRQLNELVTENEWLADCMWGHVK